MMYLVIFFISQKGMEKFFNTENWKLEKNKTSPTDSYYISILSENIRKSTFWILEEFLERFQT